MSYVYPKTKEHREECAKNIENGYLNQHVKNSEQIDVNSLTENEVKEVLEELLFQLGYKVHRNLGFERGYNKLGYPHKNGGLGGVSYKVFLLPRNEELEPVEAKFKEES